MDSIDRWLYEHDGSSTKRQVLKRNGISEAVKSKQKNPPKEKVIMVIIVAVVGLVIARQMRDVGRVEKNLDKFR